MGTGPIFHAIPFCTQLSLYNLINLRFNYILKNGTRPQFLLAGRHRINHGRNVRAHDLLYNCLHVARFVR